MAPQLSMVKPRPATDSPRVLLIAAAGEPAPAWGAGDGRPFTMALAPSLVSGIGRLARQPVDVVVLDADVAAAEAALLPRLRARLGGAAVLVRTHHYTADVHSLLERLGSGCLLPAGAPAAVQAQLVGLAADRSRLAAALAARSAELEESRARCRDVIERNADAIIVIDGEGTIRFANPMAAELFGTPREALAGTDFGFPVVSGETTELDLLSADGPRVVEMRVVESEWEGEPAHLASLRDMTARAKAEEGARRLITEQAARTVAAAAAHRFRSLADASPAAPPPLG